MVVVCNNCQLTWLSMPNRCISSMGDGGYDVCYLPWSVYLSFCSNESSLFWVADKRPEELGSPSVLGIGITVHATIFFFSSIFEEITTWAGLPGGVLSPPPTITIIYLSQHWWFKRSTGASQSWYCQEISFSGINGGKGWMRVYFGTFPPFYFLWCFIHDSYGHHSRGYLRIND